MNQLSLKIPEWEIIDLLDGRWALKRKGLVIFVGRTREECDLKYEALDPK